MIYATGLTSSLGPASARSSISPPVVSVAPRRCARVATSAGLVPGSRSSPVRVFPARPRRDPQCHHCGFYRLPCLAGNLPSLAAASEKLAQRRNQVPDGGRTDSARSANGTNWSAPVVSRRLASAAVCRRRHARNPGHLDDGVGHSSHPRTRPNARQARTARLLRPPGIAAVGGSWSEPTNTDAEARADAAVPTVTAARNARGDLICSPSSIAWWRRRRVSWTTSSASVTLASIRYASQTTPG